MKFIISQIFGAIAYSLLAYSFYKKEKKGIIFIQIMAYIGFTIHYALLDALTGTVCNIIGLVALIIVYAFLSTDKMKKILVLILTVLLFIMFILSYENIFSIFPVMACLITFYSFLCKDEDIIRFIGIISAFFWFIYALAHMSYIAILFEIVTIASTLIAYIKNRKL